MVARVGAYVYKTFSYRDEFLLKVSGSHLFSYILQVKIFLYRIVEEEEVSPVNVPELQYLPPGQQGEIFPHQEVGHLILLGEIFVEAGDSYEREDDVRAESKSLYSE